LNGTARIQAIETAGYLFVYSAKGEPFRLKPGFFKEKVINQAQWFDPRTGKYKNTKIPMNKPARSRQEWFIPPTKGQNNDWVLILSKVKNKMQ